MPKDEAARSAADSGSPATRDSPDKPRSYTRWLWASIRRFAWPLVCIFQLALLIGWLQRGHPWAVPGAQPADNLRMFVPSPDADAATAQPVVPLTPEELTRTDDLLREGKYELALAAYQTLNTSVTTALHDALDYRLALCQEGLGRWDMALSAYRLIASRTAAPQPAAAALLGQARVWIRMRRPGEAKTVLGGLILRSAQPELRDLPCLAEAKYFLALALTVEASPADKPGPHDDCVASHLATDWPVERVLDWVPLTHALSKGDKDTEPTPVSDVVSVQRLGPTPEEILISATARHTTIGDLLDQIAAQAQLRPQWTAPARQAVAGRTALLVIDHLPFPDLVRALADPLGLVTQVKEGRLEISSEHELPQGILRSYRATLAQRALRDALLACPGQTLTPAAFLELGNFDFRKDDLADAVGWYERLIRECAHSPETLEAHYNLGLAQRRLGEHAAARSAFYHVVDQAPGHELAPLAYFKVGMDFLEDEGDPIQAVTPLRRALATSPGSTSQAAAALYLAMAYLMTDNPGAAGTILLDNREQVRQARYRQAAAFLEALAHYRALPRGRDDREASDLLAAALAMPEDQALGPPGRLLLGQAYRELGMPDRMANLYRKALPTTRGPIAAEMTFVLGDALYQAEQRNEARQLFLTLAGSTAGPWHRRARLRLAEIALQEKHPDDCLANCRLLLTDPTFPDLVEVLRLMGRAYEAVGDHRQAARCFAGLLPE